MHMYLSIEIINKANDQKKKFKLVFMKNIYKCKARTLDVCLNEFHITFVECFSSPHQNIVSLSFHLTFQIKAITCYSYIALTYR